MSKLKEANLFLNFKKCNFGRKELDFLGYKIDRVGVKPSDEKLKVIKKGRRPTSLKEKT